MRNRGQRRYVDYGGREYGRDDRGDVGRSGGSRKYFPNITCHTCKKRGHYQRDCPESNKLNNMQAEKIIREQANIIKEAQEKMHSIQERMNAMHAYELPDYEAHETTKQKEPAHREDGLDIKTLNKYNIPCDDRKLYVMNMNVPNNEEPDDPVEPVQWELEGLNLSGPADTTPVANRYPRSTIRISLHL